MLPFCQAMQWTSPQARFLAFFTFAACYAVCEGEDTVQTLRPDTPRFGLRAEHGRTLLFKLEDLTDRWYEVKISYPATRPTTFILKVFSDLSSWKKRRLLNVEKLIFHPENYRGNTSDQLYLSVTAWRTGIVTNRTLLEQPAVFNLNLDSLYAGLPLHVWQAVGIMVVGLVLCLVFATPYIYRNLMSLVDCAMRKDERPHQQ